MRPAVAGASPRIALPSVVLPEPDSPTRPEDLAAAQLEIDAVDGAHRRAAPAREARQEPAAVVEVGAQRLDAHEHLAGHGRGRRARVRADGRGGALGHDARGHHAVARDLLAPVPAGLVVDVAPHAAAVGQREVARHVALAHVLGVRAARVERRSPAAAPRGSARGPGSSRGARRGGGRDGTAASSACVYGWRGALEDLLDGALLDGAAGVHHDDPVAELRDHAEVVRDEQDRRAVAVAQPSQQLEDLGLERDVERARRLVRDQQRRLEQQRHRDHDALPHAARELVRVVVQALGGVGDADLLEQLQRAPPQRRRGPASRCARCTSIIWRPTVNVGFRLVSGSWKIIAISRPRSSRSSSGGRPSRSRSRKTTLPPVISPFGGSRRSRARGERRLAAARLADDADDLARAHREADAVSARSAPPRTW